MESSVPLVREKIHFPPTVTSQSENEKQSDTKHVPRSQEKQTGEVFATRNTQIRSFLDKSESENFPPARVL